MTRLAAPIGFALGCLAALALGPGLAEVIHHAGFNPFMANGLPATGLSQVEPVPVSPLRASIPFAGEQP